MSKKRYALFVRRDDNSHWEGVAHNLSADFSEFEPRNWRKAMPQVARVPYGRDCLAWDKAEVLA